ncbi:MULTISPECIES: hypothetical protein [unclassified Pseudomonas]|uniref:TRAFAC clade GTPase domain-containing protein n=1 Tax=unclassified Pseudomonas TaxID=196821 RepID=UPI000A1DE9AA|nr:MULTISPECIES: hypothetical protein [unclassified Pseudomonas]
MTRSVLLLGGPDSGKTNYIGRVWTALDNGSGKLRAARQPSDLRFVLDVAEHLFSGNFAPRSEHADGRRDFEVPVTESQGGEEITILIPDMSGELWQNAVQDCEVSVELMEEMRRSDGALLFVRLGSDQTVRPLDWVSSQKLMSKIGEATDDGLPTQVVLCELIRFLELTLAQRPDGTRPRVSVVLSAWDLADSQCFENGPVAYLEKEYPFVAGRLRDLESLDVKVFGLSVVGGDLKIDTDFRDDFLESDIDSHGWVAVQDRSGTWYRDNDLTLPMAWVVGSQS